jgi:hypothetical protein
MAEGYIDVYQRLAQVAPSARPSGRLLPTAASLLADEALFMASPKTMITSFPIDAVTLDDSDTEVLTA